MSAANRGLAEQYEEALRDYLGGDGETALKRVYELSRDAVAQGRGVLEIAVIHNEAVSRILASSGPGRPGRIVEKAAAFQIESLSPFEMTHRAFQESNVALRHLNETLEDMVRRIAHSLHDEAGQLMAALQMALARVAEDLPPEPRERLAALDPLLVDIGESLRRISHELRPTILDDLGLLPALSFLTDSVSARTGIPITVEGSLGRRLEPSHEMALYRIVQEGLNNLVKHSSATRATIRVGLEGGGVHCLIRDDGAGFDPSAVARGMGGGLGLVGIRERLVALGGTFEIISAPGQGTELRVSIPVERHHDAIADTVGR